MIVKPKDDHQKTDIEIIKYLAHNHYLFEKEKIIHSYPHCWRCDTPLLNYASTSWFVETTKLKANLLSANQTVSWLPSHIKDGRFGKWLENVRDWAISRSRFWGAPLPVWIGRDSGKKYFIGSVDELKKYTKKSGNNYMVMRHGQSEGNLIEKVSSLKDNVDPLTPYGIQSTIEFAKKLDTKIDIIIASPFMRTGQTAEIVAKEVGIDVNDIIYDERIGELYAGEFEGKSWRDYHEYMYSHKTKDWYKKKLPGGGESLFDMVYRVSDFLYDIESKYQNKNILFVTHGGPAWGFYVAVGDSLPQNKEYSVKDNFIEGFKKFDNSEIRSFDFVPLPHNQNYEFDLHLPYIDSVNLVADDGEELVRTPEVFDCWFESGAMPYAQLHYPFENQDLFAKNFPADFIAEGQDQTRGWFYSMLVLGVALFDKSPYKNVVVNGIVLAEDGQKMSKKLKNYPDVIETVEKYGADALRLYIIGSPVVRGEDMRFSEKDLMQLKSRIISRLDNVMSFYKLYRDKDIENTTMPKTENVLDLWILAKLAQVISETTIALDVYELDKPVRAFDLFVDDLSTWYLRRSRDRLKDGDTHAKQTLYFVLKTFAQVIAPFAPFIAEDIWQELKQENNKESVHLESWPLLSDIFGNREDMINNPKYTNDMQLVLDVCTEGNALRKKLNIPLRQPLASFTVVNSFESDYVEIIKDELNVKDIIVGAEYGFDTVITPELKKEGNYRELVRALQDIRKNMGLTPDQKVSLQISQNAQDLLELFIDDFKKTVQVQEVIFADGLNEITIDTVLYKVSIVC
jgi:isoleucyl-tRNA synthetase